MGKQILILLGIVFVIVFFAWLDRRMHPGRREPIVSITPPKEKEEEEPYFIARLKAGYIGIWEKDDY